MENIFLIFPSYISTFNVSSHDSEIGFDFSWNDLTALMPDSFTTIGRHISFLHISNNNLESLPTDLFDGLYKLRWLNLAYNTLVSLPPDLFSGLHELDWLYMYNNQLESLPTGLFKGLHKLRLVYLDYNNLVSLPTGFFNSLLELNELWLSNNHLESLPTDLFNGSQNLYRLYLGNNYLVSLPAGLFNGLHELGELYLNNNLLESLSTHLFNGLHKLREVLLVDNNLVSLPAELFSNLNLTSLWLGNNYLGSLPADLFHEQHMLYELWLDSNKLVSLPRRLFSGLHELYLLSLTNNKLVSLPSGLFSGLHKLGSLSMDDNNLHALPAGLFDDLESLATLSLTNNSLVSLPNGFLNVMHYLQKLNLAGNKLKFLSFHLFDSLGNLVTLDLSDNILTHIPRLGQMTQLSNLYLVGNPLSGITHKHFDRMAENVTVVVDQSVICVCYMSDSDTCFNIKERSPYLTCNRLLSLTILSIFTWVLGVCATLGNGFVIIWKQSKYSGDDNRVQSILLTNLAGSDFLMGIYMIIIASADVHYAEYFPMISEEWRSGPICRIASILAFTSSEASVFFVTLISIDRFINIKFPYTIRKLRIKSTRWSSLVVLAISLILGLSASISAGINSEFYDNAHVCIGLPLAQLVRFDTNTTSVETGIVWVSGIPYLDFETVNVVTNEYRSPGLYFSVAVFIGLNMLCFLLILSCYIVIIMTVSQTSKAASRQRKIAEEIRMTVKVSVIVLTDFFCWFPICLVGALVQAGVVTIPPDTFAWVVTFVLPINSAINPFMYTIGTLISDKCGKKPPPRSQVQVPKT